MSFVPQVICFFVMKDLIENKIGDGGACALSEALKTNTRLFHLGLIGLFTAKWFLASHPCSFCSKHNQQTTLEIKELSHWVKR